MSVLQKSKEDQPMESPLSPEKVPDKPNRVNPVPSIEPTDKL